MKYQLYINAPIGWPISAQYVRSVLAEHEGQHVDVYVNSFGGSVVDALDIRQQFLDHGDVTCHIFGMTASAATLLAMGAKEVKMSRHALFLVHQCSKWVDTWGSMNATDLAAAIEKLQKTAEDLATVDQVAANIYADRTGKDATICAGWMKDAKWLTSDKCKEMGLIDAICEDGEHTDVTDELRAQMVACGLPLPTPSRDGKTMTKMEQFLAALKNFFNTEDDDTDDVFEDEIEEDENVIEDVVTEDEDEQVELENTETQMENVESTAICACLGVENIQANDGTVVLSVEQINALEERLSAMASITEERDALRQQVDNLLAGDGADDTDIEGDGGEDTSIADCFKALESIV